MIDAILKGLKGSKAGRASLKAGRRTIQGPVPAKLRTDAVSSTAKTKEEAVMEGVNKFTGADGRQRTVRQYDSTHHPLGSAEQTELRQQNRGASVRQKRAAKQTIGRGDFTDGATVRAPHHRLGLAQMDPAYDGLSKSEADELTAKVKKKYNTALGNRSGNRYDLPDNVHTAYHQWEVRHDTKLNSMQGMSVDQRVESLGAYFDTMARAGDEVIFHLMRNKDKGRDVLAQIANNL